MFGTEKYKDLLCKLQEKGFIFTSFEDASQNLDGRRIALRHDIDFSVESALEVSRIESDLGISSIYFFMLTSNMYNLFSKKNKLIVEEISTRGHQVSIHFDPTCYESSFLDGFKTEYASFTSAFPSLPSPKLVSIHRPGSFLDDNNQKLPNVEHTYQDKYFRKMNYYSDSGGRDVSLSVSELEPKTGSANVQILLHPIWWVQITASPTETLLNFIQSNAEIISQETSRNCMTYDSTMFASSGR